MAKSIIDNLGIALQKFAIQESTPNSRAWINSPQDQFEQAALISEAGFDIPPHNNVKHEWAGGRHRVVSGS
jgi:hypothetical protein